MINGIKDLKWFFWVGILAALCIIVYLIPQLVKTIRTKNTESLSKLMLFISALGGFLFVVSGLGIIFDSIHEGDLQGALENGLPMVIANFVSSSISLILFIIKVINSKKAKKQKISESEYAKLLLAKKAKKAKIKGK